MDIGSLAIGVIAGIVIGGLIFTSTGKEVTRATARRAAYHIGPR